MVFITKFIIIMKLIAPTYYKKFKCIADKCNDNCCIGWEIDVDKDSLNNYKKIDSSFAKNLVQNIYEGDEKNSSHFILNEKHRCPFLNDNNLCEVYINLGENAMCKICTEHPRFYEWFDNRKEIGIGLACEEACRIILSELDIFSTYETDIEFEECDSYNSELFNQLINIRNSIINYLEQSPLSLSNKLKNILIYTNNIQNCIDYDENLNNLSNMEILDEQFENSNLVDFIFNFYKSLSPLSDSWMNYLEDSINTFKDNIERFKEFEQIQPSITNYLKNISIYFIWRYFLKGVFDKDIISKIKFMYVNIFMIKVLYFSMWIKNSNTSFENYVETTKNFSKEIEYSTDNLNKFEEEFNDSYFFSTDFLKNIIL